VEPAKFTNVRLEDHHHLSSDILRQLNRDKAACIAQHRACTDPALRAAIHCYLAEVIANANGAHRDLEDIRDEMRKRGMALPVMPVAAEDARARPIAAPVQARVSFAEHQRCVTAHIADLLKRFHDAETAGDLPARNAARHELLTFKCWPAVRHYAVHAGDSSRTLLSKLTYAHKQLAAGNLAKAADAIMSDATPLTGPVDAAVVDSVRKLFPGAPPAPLSETDQARVAPPPDGPRWGTEKEHGDAVLTYLRTRHRELGKDINGLSWEILQDAVKVHKEGALHLCAAVASIVNNEAISDADRAALRLLRGVALPKKDNGIRPLGICSKFRQLCEGAVYSLEGAKSNVRNALHKGAFGIHVSAGTDAAAVAFWQSWLAAHPAQQPAAEQAQRLVVVLSRAQQPAASTQRKAPIRQANIAMLNICA
jgi:hypothetical protein